MEHTLSLDQIAYGISALILSVVGSVSILFVTMRSTYGSLIATLQTEVKALRAGRVKDRRRSRRKGREITQLQNEMASMRRQCPMLSGEVTCPIAECPVHDPKKYPKPKSDQALKLPPVELPPIDPCI